MNAEVLRSPTLQEFLCVYGRHAAGARGGNRLAIDVVLDVPAGEDAGDIGGGSLTRDDVAVLIQFELPAEDLGIGLVADGDKEPIVFKVFGLSRLHVFKL